MHWLLTPEHSASRAGRLVALVTTVVTLTVLLGATTASPLGVPRPYFVAARNLWLSEAEMVSSALQNVPLVAIVSDLERGVDTHEPGSGTYAAAIATVRGFERIPITSETQSQMRASRRDWSTLNEFFAVSAHDARVLTNDIPAGRFFNAAQRDYTSEPAGTHQGVAVGPLRRAVNALEAQANADTSREVLYAAAIVDLKSLEHASSGDISGASGLLNSFVQDIDYLNVYFRADRL